jgi:16S rRNA (guanine966-N2)-methyltransferase
LRIIAGKHRGQRIQAPAQGVRPTADRARQAVFNILEHGIAWPGFSDCGVLDLFAGTGTYGLEALSRGAALATFVDVDSAALLSIRRNAAALGEARSIVLLKLDATRLPPPARIVKAPCGLAFLDPPYESGFAVPALQGAACHGWIQNGAIAVVEVGAREPLAPPPGYAVEGERVYGAARILFLRFR